MLQKNSERVRTGFVLMVLVAAVLVRFLLAFGAEGTERVQPQESGLKSVSLRPRSAPAQEQPPAEPEVTPPEPPEPAEPPEPEPLPLPVFDPTEAEDIVIGGACSYSADPAEALQTQWHEAWTQPPAVLILHTHGTEAYITEPGRRSNDPARTVVRVGQALQEALEARGLTVYHDETPHDAASFAYAYSASGAAAAEYLSAHPEIGLVIDLHRDAALNPDGSDYAATLRTDTAELARLMLVVGTDEGGLTHPNWRQNLGCAVQLQALLRREMPGLTRDLDLRTERFNQHLLPGSLLIEVGAAGNTMEQALASMEPLADAVAALLGAKE